MQFLDAMKSKQQAARDEAFVEYAALLRKAAESGGQLEPDDQARLEALTDALNFSLERVEADAAACVRRYQIRDAHANLMATVKAMSEAEEAIRAHDDETTRITDERTATRNALAQEFNTANQARHIADDRAAELKALDASHWRLFGLPDPEATARQRHLVQVLNGFDARATTIDIIEFESVMLSPKEHVASMADQSLVYLPAPGQRRQTMQGLIDWAREITRSEAATPKSETPWLWRYLLPRADADRATRCRDAIVVFESAKADRTFELSAYGFILAPGQSGEQLAEMIESLRAAGRRHGHGKATPVVLGATPKPEPVEEEASI